jgi:UDP-glucose 4-epimerase
MRCLVTGATGFVGSWLVRRLVSEGHAVAVLVRPSSDLWRIAPWADRLTQIRGDLATIVSAKEQLADFAPEVIFHLAWSGGNSSRFNFDPAQVYANVPGSLELLRIGAACGASVFVNLGSCVEYGSYCVPVRETDSVRPSNLYGAAKYAVELLGENLGPQMQIRFASMRLFWAYGPGDDDARLLPSLFRRLRAGERQAMTPGEQVWDFCFIEDVVDALIRVAQSPNASGIFNLGSGQPVPLKDVANRAGQLLGRPDLVGIGDLPYSPGQVMHLEADVSRLRDVTGWAPVTSLEEGLQRTAAWYKAGEMSLPLFHVPA